LFCATHLPFCDSSTRMHAHAYDLALLLFALPCVRTSRLTGRIHVVGDRGLDGELLVPGVGVLQPAARPAAEGFQMTAPRDRLRAQQQLTKSEPPLTDKPPRTDELPPTVARFTEADTGVPVILVGTVHCNPASIDLAAATVREANSRDRIRAVCVELCDTRWNATAERLLNATAGSASAPSLKRWLLLDEFVAAFQATMACDEDIRFDLVDQPIETTAHRLASLSKQTVVDIASGPSGWRRIADDIRSSGATLVGMAAAVKDPALLAGMPVTLLRTLATTPLGLLLIAFLVSVGPLVDSVDPSPPADRQFVEVALALAVLATEVRAALVGLLEERNAVMAGNIRRACQRPSSRGQAGGVVAILGLAHVNGVRQILEQPSSPSD